MFRVATRSFAPAHIGCARAARLLECRIAGMSYQRGLLEIAELIAGTDATTGAETSAHSPLKDGESNWWLDALKAADRGTTANLVRAMAGISSWGALLR